MSWGIETPEILIDKSINKSNWMDAFNHAYHLAFKEKDQVKSRLIKKGTLGELKDHNYNNEIAEWVLQEERSVRILDLDQGLSTTASPIHHHTNNVSGINAPYYSAYKSFIGWDINTPYYNVLMLWLMTAIAWGILRFKPLNKH